MTLTLFNIISLSLKWVYYIVGIAAEWKINMEQRDCDSIEITMD